MADGTFWLAVADCVTRAIPKAETSNLETGICDSRLEIFWWKRSNISIVQLPKCARQSLAAAFET